MARSKTIKICLLDGDSAGSWQATIGNYSIVAYKIPRKALKGFGEASAISVPGVYFLFGFDDFNQPFVYVGEGEDVYKRVLQAHTFEKDGSYWTEVIILVSSDDSLDKGKVRYLEHRFHNLVSDNQRYIIKNANVPTKSPLSKAVQDQMEDFIDLAKLVVPTLGHSVLEPKPTMESDDDNDLDDIFYFERRGGQAGKGIGRLTNDGFWVLKGSYINPETASYLPISIKKMRDKCAEHIDKKGILQVDIKFGSPSYASSFVCGKNSNGLIEWKNKNGVSIKELDRSSTNTEYPADDSCNNVELLYLRGKSITASGYRSGDGIVVLKGSEYSLSTSKTCGNTILNLRARLSKENKIKDGVFLEDVAFSSLSAASGCVYGRRDNGWTSWKNMNGICVKDLESK